MELPQRADLDTQALPSALTCSSLAVGNTLRLRMKSLYFENALTDQKRLRMANNKSKVRWTRWMAMFTDRSSSSMEMKKDSIRTARATKSSELGLTK